MALLILLAILLGRDCNSVVLDSPDSQSETPRVATAESSRLHDLTASLRVFCTDSEYGIFTPNLFPFYKVDRVVIIVMHMNKNMEGRLTVGAHSRMIASSVS